VNNKVGEVVHYYDKIGVAVVKLEGDLHKGDKIRFEQGEENKFEQDVESMQNEHNNIDSANAGQEIAIKVNEEVKKGTEVYKV
jgi:translation initiation factor IF-2